MLHVSDEQHELFMESGAYYDDSVDTRAAEAKAVTRLHYIANSRIILRVNR